MKKEKGTRRIKENEIRAGLRPAFKKLLEKGYVFYKYPKPNEFIFSKINIDGKEFTNSFYPNEFNAYLEDWAN